MHIEIHGDGPDLVLIHGWAMHGGIFAPLLAALVPHFRVHVVDLPGHGYSRDEVHFDVADSARRIATATPRALWAGWSLGGLVALRAALDRPEQVRGVGLIASSPRFVSTGDWSCGVGANVFAEFGAELQARYRHAIERFLALETMGSTHAQAELRELNGRAVALISAPGGRGMLRTTLAERGAALREVHVYRRVPARLDRRHVDAVRRLPASALLLLSSAESWHNLAAALPPDALRRLCATTAVVSSERLAGIAAAAGFARIRQAASAMADDLLAAAIGS